MNRSELNQFNVSSVDCDHEEDVVAMLESQKPSLIDKFLNQFSTGAFRYKDGSQMFQESTFGYSNGDIYTLVRDVRRWCSYKRQLDYNTPVSTNCYPIGIGEVKNDGRTYQPFECINGKEKRKVWRLM
jgi:hypothetical protein